MCTFKCASFIADSRSKSLQLAFGRERSEMTRVAEAWHCQQLHHDDYLTCKRAAGCHRRFYLGCRQELRQGRLRLASPPSSQY